MFAVIVVPLLRVAEVGERLRRQLRLVDHHPDDHHQRRHVPAAAQERRVDAEDAGDSAGGKAIQDRYAKLKATDPAKQKMNQEMMALYRERGVNPASGCVPMLLTMPVLLAFYALLSTAIELRGAPFFGWIHDLSRHDPYLRHAGADGRQPDLAAADDAGDRRRSGAAEDDDVHAGHLHVLLPVAPAGVAHLLVRQQPLGHRPAVPDELSDRSARTSGRPRPPAERRVKRVGSGKTEAAAREN